MIGVISRRQAPADWQQNDLYADIGRSSKWGNPFTHKTTHTLTKYVVKTRDEAIEKFREWFTTSDEAAHLRDAIHELKDKILVCWCKPLACHGDVLVELANN